jgi:hypothetical protein
MDVVENAGTAWLIFIATYIWVFVDLARLGTMWEGSTNPLLAGAFNRDGR